MGWPASVKVDYDAFVERAENVAQRTHAVADAAESKDIGKVMEATGNVAGEAQSHRLARKIGFKVCRGGSVSLLPPGMSTPDVPGRLESP